MKGCCCGYSDKGADQGLDTFLEAAMYVCRLMAALPHISCVTWDKSVSVSRSVLSSGHRVAMPTAQGLGSVK